MTRVRKAARTYSEIRIVFLRYVTLILLALISTLAIVRASAGLHQIALINSIFAVFLLFGFILNERGRFKLASHLVLIPALVMTSFVHLKYGNFFPGPIIGSFLVASMSLFLLGKWWAIVYASVVLSKIIVIGIMHDTGVVVVHTPDSPWLWYFSISILFTIFVATIYPFYWVNEKTIAELNRSREIKARQLASLSHEIRTPLTGMLGVLTQKKHNLTESEFELLLKTSNDLLQIVNRTLEYSKLEAKKILLKRRPTEIRSSFTSAIRLYEPLARTREIAIEHEIKSRVPEYIWLDIMRIKQIIGNLLQHAIKYCPGGKIGIFIDAIELKGNENKMDALLIIKIKDNGPGIPDQYLKNIFEEYYQVEAQVQRHPSSGLGLKTSSPFTGAKYILKVRKTWEQLSPSNYR